MSIIFHEGSKTFHLFNEEISYIICVLSNGHIGNLYFGKKIHDREDFSYLIESKQRPMTACVYEGNRIEIDYLLPESCRALLEG